MDFHAHRSTQSLVGVLQEFGPGLDGTFERVSVIAFVVSRPRRQALCLQTIAADLQRVLRGKFTCFSLPSFCAGPV